MSQLKDNPIGLEQFSSIGTMYEVIKNVGRKDGVLFDNIDAINISYNGTVFNVERPEMDTAILVADNKSYTIVNKEMLTKSSKENPDDLEKDYLLIEGLMFNFYKLEAEKEKGTIDTTNTPSILEYIKPISETLKEKYVELKIHSEYYREIKYKLKINEMGIIIEEI